MKEIINAVKFHIIAITLLVLVLAVLSIPILFLAGTLYMGWNQIFTTFFNTPVISYKSSLLVVLLAIFIISSLNISKNER